MLQATGTDVVQVQAQGVRPTHLVPIAICKVHVLAGDFVAPPASKGRMGEWKGGRAGTYTQRHQRTRKSLSSRSCNQQQQPRPTRCRLSCQDSRSHNCGHRKEHQKLAGRQGV